MTKPTHLDLSQVNQQLHWAFNYLGIPWVKDGNSLDGFNCFTLFKFVEEKHFGVTFNDYSEGVDANNSHAISHAIKRVLDDGQWKIQSIPNEGDGVLMVHAKHPHHVGVYLDVDDGGVLHCVRDKGVVFSTLSALQVNGWGRVEFYRYASNA